MGDKKHNSGKSRAKALRGGDTVSRDSSTHSEAIQAKPLEVKVYGNNFEKAMKAFKALVQKEKILSLYKERQSYEKPSDKKRRKRNESCRKAMETERSNNPDSDNRRRSKKKKRKAR